MQGDTKFTSKAMSCRVCAIDKAIRPLFADWVTNVYILKKGRPRACPNRNMHSQH